MKGCEESSKSNSHNQMGVKSAKYDGLESFYHCICWSIGTVRISVCTCAKHTMDELPHSSALCMTDYHGNLPTNCMLVGS